MAYNKAKEEKKWRLWKEAEEKQLRNLGVNEDDRLPSVELGMPVASDNSCRDILFSATLKSFSRSAMVSLVCIVNPSFQRYR